MKRILVVLLFGLAGCSTQPPATKAFYAQERVIAASCMGPLEGMTGDQRFTVDPVMHSAPISRFIQCYSGQVRATASMTRYQHKDVVFSFTDYLDSLAGGIDRGAIDKPAAWSAYTQSFKTFSQSLASADERVSAQARKQFMDRLAALGSAYAEQDRQRAAAAAANRPVTCRLTGVYVQNTVVCN